MDIIFSLYCLNHTVAVIEFVIFHKVIYMARGRERVQYSRNMKKLE